ncbi:MAG: hypothetical protein ACR2FS_03115 [Phormidesmis sp.]
MVTEERHDGPTPNGGAYSIGYFQDSEGKPTTKDKAVSIEAVEFDATGNQIFRTYLVAQGDRTAEGDAAK